MSPAISILPAFFTNLLANCINNTFCYLHKHTSLGTFTSPYHLPSSQSLVIFTNTHFLSSSQTHIACHLHKHILTSYSQMDINCQLQEETSVIFTNTHYQLTSQTHQLSSSRRYIVCHLQNKYHLPFSQSPAIHTHQLSPA